MRTNLYNFLSNPIVVIITISFCVILTYLYGRPGYIFGIVIALTTLWLSKFNWTEFGISRPKWPNTLLKALFYSLIIYVLMDVFIQPFIESAFGTIDISDLNGIRGNLINYLTFIVFIWVVTGFGEELLYRGYFMKRLALILGDSNKAWITAAFMISILFGLAHSYQGVSGIITTGIISFILCIVFYRNRTNLILVMLTHGFYDVIGITLIYLRNH